MFVAEVIETKWAFKPDQTDYEGNPLPLGSIEIRIGSHQNNLGQVRNVFARPCTFNRRVPLIGEQVIVISGGVNDWSSSGEKGVGFLYLAPINSTDDLVLHQFPKLWARKGRIGGSGGQRKADREEPGYTFPKTPKKTENIQIFEGDDLLEGRFGASLRMGSTVTGGDMSVYEKKPTWKGSANGDPLMILRVKKPEGGTSQAGNTAKKYRSKNKYTIEDLETDEASIYLATTQTLNSLKGGFDKNMDVKKLGNYQGKGQIVVDSERVVVNAKKDMLFLIGAKEAILTGKKVLFQSDKYKVDLDDLMDFLQDWLKQDNDLASGKASYSSPAGPTSVSTNVSSYIQLLTSDFNKFKQP